MKLQSSSARTHLQDASRRQLHPSAPISFQISGTSKPQRRCGRPSPHAGMLGCTAAAVTMDLAPALSPAPVRQPQTTADLDQFIASNGIEASLVKEEDKVFSPEGGPAVIKSLVFMADGKPLLVVVLGTDKVEARKVADVLGLARRRVRLATPEEALQATGYQIGTIPPFGHAVKLQTLLDAAVTQQSVVYGGGGDPDVEVMVAVPELLHFIQPEVADVAVRPAGPDPFPPSAASAAAPGLDLPLPWAPGSKAVRMVALVTKTRRVAKRLMFVNVVPESVHELPAKVQASYLRRLWKSPLDLAGPPVEVQLILGSTIERTLGAQRCEELLSSIKLGSVIFISGVVQDRPQKAARPEGDLDPKAAKSEARVASRGRVLDVVCHRVSRIFPDKRALQRTLDQVQRQAGNDWVVSAADLELLRWKQQQQQEQDQQQQQQQVDEVLPQVQDADPQQQARGAADAAIPDSAPGARPRSRGRASSARQRGPAASAAAAAALETWQLPLPLSEVHLVHSLPGLRLAREAVFGQSGAAASGTVVVGIDCEWRPEESRGPRYPVALMQVALRERVLLLDLLTLCNAGQPLARQPPADCTQLSELQRETGHFIRDLLTSGQVLKLGFSLASDLDRLSESYPWILSLPSAPKGMVDAVADAGRCSMQGTEPQQGAAGAAPESCDASSSSSRAQQLARDAAVARLAAAGVRVRSAVGCLDLGLLARKATSSSSSSGSGSGSRCILPTVAASSLSRLAEAVLGLPLDKTQQRSDWAQRPLTQQQLQYAAMDAHVLIAILDRVLERGYETSQETGSTPQSLEQGLVIRAGHASALFNALSSDLT